MAMFLVIGLLAVLMMLSGTLFLVLHQSVTQLSAQSRHQVCLNLAEAGVNKALAEFQAGHANYTGEERTPLGEGFFTVTAGKQDDGSLLIEAVGTLGDVPEKMAKARLIATAVMDNQGRLQRFMQHEVH